MKHAFWDRLLIVLCALMLLGISAMLLGMVIGFLPASLLIEQIGLLASNRVWRVILCVVAAALIVLAGFVFWIILPRRKGRFSTFALQRTEHGVLKIAVKALENLVEKCTSQHPELAIVSSAIYSNEDTVRVELRVTLQSDINIPLAICALQKQIKQYVEACSGVDVDEVLVTVEATVPLEPGTDSPYAIPDTEQPQLPKLEEQPEIEKEVIKALEPELDPEPEPLPPEPMPDWLLEREPGVLANDDTDDAQKGE
ncbi:MAG: alkaline shock response membrane anchor protein AmaP [Clostridia bacterium]|nr:alkaline shock response membrane anchor protein AmaP [Clostridia bacterium]